MERTRSASDKIRPFLEAMERSIDKVRRERLQESGEAGHPLARGSESTNGQTTGQSAHYGAPAPSHATSSSTPGGSPASNDEPVIGRTERPGANSEDATHDPNGDNGGENTPPQRLKARPKRPSSFTNPPFGRDNYRSQAG